MLVKPAGDAGDENCRYENRGQNQCQGNHRSRHLIHRLERGVLGQHALFNVPFGGFDHNNRIIDHEADRQHQAEK